VKKWTLSFILVLLSVLGGCKFLGIGGEGNGEEEINPNTSIEVEQKLPFSDKTGEVKTGYYQGNLIEYEFINGYAIYDFDIILDESDVSESARMSVSKGAARESSSVYWPNRTVYYEFDSTFTEKSATEKAIEFYEDMGFDFIVRTDESNYIDFISGDPDKGYCSSDLGMGGGRQYIHLASGYGFGTALHEIGHALGLYHENSRSDRDTYLTIDWSNIKSGKSHNFKTYDEQNFDGFDYHNFDWMSIMLYHSYSFSDDPGKPTITRKDGTVYGTQHHGLSAGDIKTLYKMYPHTHKIWSDLTAAGDDAYHLIYEYDGIIHKRQHSSGSYWSGAGSFNSYGSGLDITTPPGGAMTIVSRADSFVDVFTAADDGYVYTAAVDPDGWGGWWKVLNLKCNPGDRIAATARGNNRLDIFAVGADGGVYTAAWDVAVDDGKWRGWWHIRGGYALCGTEPAAVTRDPNKLDVFVVGLDGDVWTAAWDHNQADSEWRGWWSLGTCGQAVTSVSAAASSAGRIHVFAVRLDGKIFSNQWDGEWSGWNQVGDIIAQPGAKVRPVSRKEGFVDIFVMDDEQHIRTAAWEAGRDSDNIFRGWWDLGSNFTESTQISAGSDDPDTLMVVGISGNGSTLWWKKWEGSWPTDWTMVIEPIY
jgi:hypothetical protein